jgi:hypothetical protein
MSYETRAYDRETDFGPEPVVVMVVEGTHDVSRLVRLLNANGATVEQNQVGEQLRRQVRRHNGGRAALDLLRAHGGPDFTKEEDS